MQNVCEHTAIITVNVHFKSDVVVVAAPSNMRSVCAMRMSSACALCVCVWIDMCGKSTLSNHYCCSFFFVLLLVLWLLLLLLLKFIYV